MIAVIGNAARRAFANSRAHRSALLRLPAFGFVCGNLLIFGRAGHTTKQYKHTLLSIELGGDFRRRH